MKKAPYFFAALLLIFSINFAFAQKKAKVEILSMKVYGNCTQCKERIELALDTKGVKFAEWNVDTKELRVRYKPDKISIEQIHEKVAAVGHDTELKKAPDSVYQKLPDCCLYREKPNTHHD